MHHSHHPPQSNSGNNGNHTTKSCGPDLARPVNAHCTAKYEAAGTMMEQTTSTRIAVEYSESPWSTRREPRCISEATHTTSRVLKTRVTTTRTINITSRGYRAADTTASSTEKHAAPNTSDKRENVTRARHVCAQIPSIMADDFARSCPPGFRL